MTKTTLNNIVVGSSLTLQPGGQKYTLYSTNPAKNEACLCLLGTFLIWKSLSTECYPVNNNN